MKIICIARNYSLHAAEMGAPQFQRGSREAVSPAFFLKPDTALLASGEEFHYPTFSHEVDHELELVVRIDRESSSILEEQATQYYSKVTVGIDFTARDLQREAKAKGLPWTLSKGFDGSAAIGKFVSIDELGSDVQSLHFALMLNGNIVQQGCSADMLCPVNRMIAYLSTYITLQAGDLIYTGTPAGVGSIASGDTLTAYLEGRELLNCKVV